MQLHATIAPVQDEDVKMMAGCIQLDMECDAIFYAAAHTMNLGGKQINKSG
ncbi:MAG: hypothetical protein ABI760_04255 [Ferruginibacter sp.]